MPEWQMEMIFGGRIERALYRKSAVTKSKTQCQIIKHWFMAFEWTSNPTPTPFVLSNYHPSSTPKRLREQGRNLSQASQNVYHLSDHCAKSHSQTILFIAVFLTGFLSNLLVKKGCALNYYHHSEKAYVHMFKHGVGFYLKGFEIRVIQNVE